MRFTYMDVVSAVRAVTFGATMATVAGSPAPSRSGAERLRRSLAVTHADGAWYFRGTSAGFPGSRALQEIGVTSVSTDPVVATIFATESNSYGIGVVHIAAAHDLPGVRIIPGNVLAEIECEAGVELHPAEFARRATHTIAAEQARTILRELGIAVPSIIRGPAGVDAALKSLSRLNQEQVRQFVDAARFIAER